MLKVQGGKLNQSRGHKIVELAKGKKSEDSTTDSNRKQSSAKPSSSKNKNSIENPEPFYWLGQINNDSIRSSKHPFNNDTGEVWEKFDHEHDSFMKIIDEESHHRLREFLNIESYDVAGNEGSGMVVTASVELQNDKNNDNSSQLLGSECTLDHPLAPHDSLQPDTPQDSETVDFVTNCDSDGRIKNKESMQTLREFYHSFSDNFEAGNGPGEIWNSDTLPYYVENNNDIHNNIMNQEPTVPLTSQPSDVVQIDGATGAGSDKPETLQHLEKQNLLQAVPSRERVEVSEAPHSCQQNGPPPPDTSNGASSISRELFNPMEANKFISPGIIDDLLSQSHTQQINNSDDSDSTNSEPPELQNLCDSDEDPAYEVDTDFTDSEEELIIENKKSKKCEKGGKGKKRNELHSMIGNNQLPETSQSNNIFQLPQLQQVQSPQPGNSQEDDDNLVQLAQNQAVPSPQHAQSHNPVNNSRKRQRNVGNWLKTQAKEKRNTGQAYISTTKKLYPGKALGNGCNESCRFKCGEKIPVEQRMSLFSRFWKIGDLQRQREFVRGLMTEIPLPTMPAPLVRKRSPNMAFYFMIDGSKIRVCKQFFMSVLKISHRWISTIRAKTSDGILEPDLRGRHSNRSRVDGGILEDMRAHIQSIPRIESHYLRAQTSRQFISGDKSISEIYRDYVKFSEEKGRPFGTADRFRRLFVSEFNISFFIPKKDQCDFCTAYGNLTPEEKENGAEALALHETSKDIARCQKEDDKTKTGDDVIVATFDLQKSLETPKGDVSQYYYKSKLSTYNLTIFELKTKKGYCNVWHEGEGKRGSIEIGSCVFKYIETKIRQIPGDEPLHFIFYSDNCAGQQKNKFLIAMYMCASLRFPRIASITHKYLVTGHTQNEGDNMHSMIEKEISLARKKGPIYEPSQYVQLMRTAKKKPPYYEIKELTHKDFIDFKLLQKEIGDNFNVNSEGQKVPFSKIVATKFMKEKPFSFFYKLSFLEEYKEIAVNETNVEEHNLYNLS